MEASQQLPWGRALDAIRTAIARETNTLSTPDYLEVVQRLLEDHRRAIHVLEDELRRQEAKRDAAASC